MAAQLPRGIGTDSEVDQANRWLREQPWLQSWLVSQGQNPAQVHLSDQQRQQLLSMARTRGVGISNDFEIDPSGNIDRKGHKLRNTLIGAGLGGLALTGFGAAGMGPLSGLFGGAGASGAAAGGAAGLGGVEAGAVSGLGAAALPGAGTALGAAGGAVLPSTAIGTGAMGPIAGGTGMASGAGGAAAMGNMAKNIAGGGSGGTSDLIQKALGIGLPVGAFAAQKAMSGGSDESGIDPELMDALRKLAQLQVNRAERTEPTHEAAQAMALRLAPGYARGGR